MGRALDLQQHRRLDRERGGDPRSTVEQRQNPEQMLRKHHPDVHLVAVSGDVRADAARHGDEELGCPVAREEDVLPRRDRPLVGDAGDPNERRAVEVAEQVRPRQDRDDIRPIHHSDARSAACAFGTVCAARTKYQARSTLPRSSMRNDERVMPTQGFP